MKQRLPTYLHFPSITATLKKTIPVREVQANHSFSPNASYFYQNCSGICTSVGYYPEGSTDVYSNGNSHCFRFLESQATLGDPTHYLFQERLIYIVLHKPFPSMPWYLLVYSTKFPKTLWEKEKLLVQSNFSFSHSVFYLFGEFSAIFVKSKIVVCKLFQFGRV